MLLDQRRNLGFSFLINVAINIFFVLFVYIGCV